MADFHFDFDAVKGMHFTDGAEVLFKQMEDHYNKNFQNPKLVFGDKTVSKMSSFPMPKLDMIDPDMIDPEAMVHPIVKGEVDTKTITLKTINMKSFSIKDGKELGLKEGDAVLKGVTDKGAEVFDKLLPGYDQPPYGPVVQGESGRYNLNPKGQ